ncbi:ABC transporter permease [Streptomyces sp. NBC_00178]|uniref:FtsX-like permease family protein n=1 Tax=Streptomyces sp. NBC_00178 TaxID=2975672 RepID=UPI002E2B78EB|nr:FtsX-like permease family protein [Streptomyces sp. NBC_00178]
MSFLSGWRAALRIARRDALRAKGRSALVVAMIALPVLGVTALDVTHRSSTPTTAEKLTADMGSADAVFSSADVGPVPVEQLPDPRTYDIPPGSPKTPGGAAEPVDVPGALPDGSRYITEQFVPATFTTRHGLIAVETTELRTSDPMVRGMLDLVDGDYPKGKGEVVATEHFLESTGLRIGSRTTLRGPEQTYTITGTVELHSVLGADRLYADPGAVIAPWTEAAARDKKIVPPSLGGKKWLVQGPAGVGITWPDVLAANKKGVLALSRQVALDPPPDTEVPLASRAGGGIPQNSTELRAEAVTVIAMAMLEIVLLAGPAFAVGARRSRRQLGLVGACGGDRQHVRAVVLGGGVVLGGSGAVVGVAAGLGLTVLLRPWIEDWAGMRFGSLDIRPWELLAIALLGLVTGVLAALAPAIVAGRQSVLESLTGRRGARRSSRVLPVLGCVALAGGATIAVAGGTTGDAKLVAGGSIVAELGMLACIPVIVGLLGRLGSRLPLAPRMALRDAARNRGRTAPAVAAVMAAVAGTVAIATYTAGVTAEHDYDHVPMLTPGTAALLESGEPEPGRLSVARNAVEHSAAVRAGRADFARVWAGSDCSVYYLEENDCGTIQLVKPTGEGHDCPLEGPGARKLAERLSADAHKKLMSTPACVDARPGAGSFDTDEAGILVGGAAVLTSYAKLDDPAAAEALANGTPVLLNPAYAEHGRVTLKAVHTYSRHDKENHRLHPGGARTTTNRLKVYVAPAKYAATPGIRMIMPPGTAERIGLHTRDHGSFYTVDRPPTAAENQALEAAFSQIGYGAFLMTEQGPSSQDEDVALMILALFAGVVTLGAAAITTGLAKADADADLTTLSAVGAPPGVRRSLSGFQCLVVALTGVLLGTVAGIVPAVALRLVDLREAMQLMRKNPMDSAYTPIVLPWQTIGLLALVVPVLAGLLAAAFAGSRAAATRRAG